MTGDWTTAENVAAVEDYLAMLEAEVAGTRYNKSEHRRQLLPRLNGRSARAVEDKHMNISAVLLELDERPIVGYKPLFNFQRELRGIVNDALDAAPTLLKQIEDEVDAPVAAPSVDDILAALVAPPPARARIGEASEIVSEPVVIRRMNALPREAANRSLGTAGENFVCDFEVARLISEGAGKLAAKVEHVAATQGDGLGYDVLSFESDGRERLIEVKTTRYVIETPFYVTRNEMAVSRRDAQYFHLYRVFDFLSCPRFYVKRGQLEREFVVDPIVWSARTL